eukprot:5904653-Alexandrium_andersonii.AAC.1
MGLRPCRNPGRSTARRASTLRRRVWPPPCARLPLPPSAGRGEAGRRNDAGHPPGRRPGKPRPRAQVCYQCGQPQTTART